MIGVAVKILRKTAKSGEISMDEALKMCGTKNKSHLDQYPLALLIEENYLGRSKTYQTPEGFGRMRELYLAIDLHMYTLPKNEMGERHYMGSISTGDIDPTEERVFIKAKGALYLDEQRAKFKERLYSFVFAVLVGLIVACFSARIH